MGKRIRVQRRGRGGTVFRALTHKRVAPARYPPSLKKSTELLKARVERLVHDPGRGAPLALIKCENGTKFYNIAPENIYLRQEIQIGADASASNGNILPLSNIPEGSTVYNLEINSGDGGKIARSSGAFATVISRSPTGVTLKLKSGKSVVLNGTSLATVGRVSGAGRTEKPFFKAGSRYHLMRAKGRKYPMTKGVAMIAAVHPFGGGRHKHPGKPVTISRNAPPGRKVGLISARLTGRARKERAVAG